MTALTIDPPASAAPDSRKRQQILDGARGVFLEHGYDGTSVNNIVKAAGVSKGTVYAYFPSKERLFETMVFEDRRRQAERLFNLDGDDRPLEMVLRDLGLRLIRSIAAPEAVAYVRIVIAAAGKFPELGRAFFEAGPNYAMGKLARYFADKTAAGELKVTNPERAAAQFLELCHCGVTKPLLFGLASEIPDAKLVEAVDSAVDMFLSYYGR